MSKPKVVTIVSTLTESELKLFKAAFDYCDLTGNGLVNNRDVATGMRLLMQNPTNADVEQITAELDEKAVGSLDFVQFVTAVFRPPLTPLIFEEDVREAFRCLDDTDDCLLPVALITGYLTALGERLDDEEMGELLKYGDPEKTGFLDYERFVTAICHPPQPEKQKKKKKSKK